LVEDTAGKLAGMVKIRADRDNRQPSPKGFLKKEPMDAVHRLDGDRVRFTFKRALRYSRSLPRGSPSEEPFVKKGESLRGSGEENTCRGDRGSRGLVFSLKKKETLPGWGMTTNKTLSSSVIHDHYEAEFIKRWIVHPLIGNVSWV
jgi:hypothetical protein